MEVQFANPCRIFRNFRKIDSLDACKLETLPVIDQLRREHLGEAPP